MPCVFIIVLNWNGAEDTIACIYSLKQLKYDNFKIVIVDNGSTDDSVEQIRKNFPEVCILENDCNKGYAAGNNIGIQYAVQQNADYIWILNNDTIVADSALSPLVKKMQRNASIGICGSLLAYYDNRNIVQALGGGHYNKWLGITRYIGNGIEIDSSLDFTNVESTIDFISGASMFVSRNFIETVGLMNEDYFLFYEEMDWALRGGDKFRLGFAPGSIVYHKEGASVNSGKKKLHIRSKTGDYYQIKNRLKFSRRFYPWFLPTVYLTVIYAFFNRLSTGQIERAVMILKLLFTFKN